MAAKQFKSPLTQFLTMRHFHLDKKTKNRRKTKLKLKVLKEFHVMVIFTKYIFSGLPPAYFSIWLFRPYKTSLALSPSAKRSCSSWLKDLVGR